MKIWKLVSGIISIVLFIIITFQSCATSVVNVLEENETDMSAEGGIFVAFVLLVAGIVSVCVWRNASRGADVALFLLYGIAALLGFMSLGTFSDLEIWSWWAAICSGMAFISLFMPRNKMIN